MLRNDGGRCILIDFSGVATTRAAKMSAKFNAVNDLMEQEVEVDPSKLVDSSALDSVRLCAYPFQF